MPERRVAANGIEYSLTDEGSGPAVLLLHGFPDTSALWRHQIPPLVKAGLRAIAPDLRGRGKTQLLSKADDYAILAMVPDLVAVLDELEVERAHVVGHDFGAALAWVFAALRPDRVDRLVVLSVGHPAARGARPTLDELQKGWYRLLFLFEGIAEEVIQQDSWYLFRELLQSNPDVEEYVADLSRPGRLTAALNWYRANTGVKRLVGPPPNVPAVQMPTLGMWSTGDLYLGEQPMQRSKEFVKGSWQYERIEDANHWIPLDQPQHLNRLLLEFLH
jgi:pimeloyl-ACP methyl ester carboxylesterase